MTELPAGWAAGTAGELCAVVGGATPRTDTPEYWGGDVSWLTPDDLSRDRSQYVERGRRSLTSAGLASCAATLVPSGAVLFTSRAPIGYVAIATRPMTTNQGFKSLVPSPALRSEFLYWQLQHLTDQVRSMGSGTTFAEVSKKVMARVPLVVAPMAEQERIVAAIEEAFSKLDAGDAGLKTARQRLKRMRDAVLADAVSGRLVPQDPGDTPAAKLLADLGVETLAIGGSSVLPASWARTTVGAIAVVGTGTTPSRSNPGYWAGGTIPWASSALLNDGSITSTSEFVTPAALRETSLRVWPAGTLLVAMYGEGRTRGKCAELGIDAACNQACAAISLRDGLTSMRRFLRLVFDASYQANRRLASGGVQPNLNLGLVRSIEVPLPPANEQQRIVTEVERQFSFIDACERAADTALARSAALRRSVLKAAFEGKLVAQDPADEPASVLLERIRGEHEAVGVAPKRPRRARAGPT